MSKIHRIVGFLQNGTRSIRGQSVADAGAYLDRIKKGDGYKPSTTREPAEVRRFFERIVEQKLDGEPALPKEAVSAVVIQTAAALAFPDRPPAASCIRGSEINVTGCGRGNGQTAAWGATASGAAFMSGMPTWILLEAISVKTRLSAAWGGRWHYKQRQEWYGIERNLRSGRPRNRRRGLHCRGHRQIQ